MYLSNFIKIHLSSLTADQTNWLKGILILFVIADHNDFLRMLAPDFFRPLTFHVIGFFLLSFYGSYSSKKRINVFITERTARYIWPFFIFYSFYAFVTFLFSGDFKFDFFAYLFGLTIGSFDLVKKGCGGAFMWFLPALLGFSIIVKLFASFDTIFSIYFLFISSLFFLFAGNISPSILSSIPLGIGVALYLMPIIMLFFAIYSLIFDQLILNYKIRLFTSFTIASICHIILMNSQLNFEVGSLQVPSIGDSVFIFVNLVGSIFSLIFLWQCVKWCKFFDSSVASIGKFSLMIYLIHPLFSGVFSRLFLIPGLTKNSSLFVILAIISYVFSVVCSWLFAIFFRKNLFLNSIVFPRDLSDLKKLSI